MNTGKGMTFQQKSIFMERLVDFALAARKLEEAWKDGGEFCTQYPFAESFDETFVKILEWQGQCAKDLNAAQLVAANTPAAAVLDITDNGMEFRKYCSEKAISYTILGTTFNGWSAEFRGSRLALEQMVADYWGDEDGTMGEQEKIQDVKGAQQ